MKLNNRGFAISSIMYIILVLTLVLITAILGLLSSRKLILDKVKNTALSEINENLSHTRYKIGDTFTLSDEQYYVIGVGTDYITGLKAEPLTVDEVNTYGTGHINRYTHNSTGTARNINGYGGVAFYSSDTCGWVNGSHIASGCEYDYNLSEVKYVVNAWRNDKFNSEDLKADENGFKSRLIMLSELQDLGYVLNVLTNYSSLVTSSHELNENVPTWVYNSNYSYWTMTYYNSSTQMFFVRTNGSIGTNDVANDVSVIRPVINVLKSALD